MHVAPGFCLTAKHFLKIVVPGFRAAVGAAIFSYFGYLRATTYENG